MQFVQLGLTPYQDAWDIQREIFQRVIRGEDEDTLILVEHPHVYTYGHGANVSNILLSNESLLEIGAEKFEIERGGDVTYHGPGQLVGYPILNLAHFKMDVGWYLRALEETIIEVLASYARDPLNGTRDAVGFRIGGRTGVWVGDPGKEEKICAIGVRTSRWCTMHGFAFNVSTDLSYFQHIVPCGISDRGVTSLKNILKREVLMEEVCERYIAAFENVFDVTLTNSLAML